MFIAPALERYYSRAPVPRASKKLLAEQFMYFAWKYYHGDDMKNFRRCVARSFFYAPSVTGLMLLVKSVLGKTLMEHIHTIKTALK
jgi:hypothetical protein